MDIFHTGLVCKSNEDYSLNNFVRQECAKNFEIFETLQKN